jgi:hypothetical protein
VRPQARRADASGSGAAAASACRPLNARAVRLVARVAQADPLVEDAALPAAPEVLSSIW